MRQIVVKQQHMLAALEERRAFASHSIEVSIEQKLEAVRLLTKYFGKKAAAEEAADIPGVGDLCRPRRFEMQGTCEHT